MKTLRKIVLVAAAGAFTAANAADWQMNPTVQAGVMMDDNLRLDTGTDKADVSGGFARAEFEFRALTQRSDFRITPSVDATYFPASEDSDEDYVNGALDLDWTHRGLTTTNRFYAGYQDAASVTENRITTDPDGGGLGQPNGGDSGTLTLQNRVRVARFGDSFSYNFSERRAIELSADYQDRTYDEDVVGSDVSFTALNGSVGWRQATSERSAITLRGTFLHYDPKIVGGTTDNYGVEAEWNHQVSERIEAYVRLGTNHATYQDAPVGADNSKSSFVGGAGGSWRFQTARLFLDYTQSIDPNSSGFSVLRDQVRLRYLKDFSQRFALLLAARYVADDGPDTVYSDRTYGVGTVGAEWRLRRIWSVVAKYDYSTQDYSGPTPKATSNAVHLSVVYKPSRGAEESGGYFLER